VRMYIIYAAIVSYLFLAIYFRKRWYRYLQQYRHRQDIRRLPVDYITRLPSRDPNQELQYRRYLNGKQQDPRD
jgi:hypothetical protein